MKSIELLQVDIPISDVNLLCVNSYVEKNYVQARRYSEVIIKNLYKEEFLHNKIQYYFNYAFINKIFVSVSISIKYFMLVECLATKNIPENCTKDSAFLSGTVFNVPISLDELLTVTKFIIGELYFRQKKYTVAKKFLELYNLDDNRLIINKYYKCNPLGTLINYYEDTNDIDNMIKYCVTYNNKFALLSKLETTENNNNFIKKILQYFDKTNYDLLFVEKFVVNDNIDLFYIVDKLIDYEDYQMMKNIIIKHIDKCDSRGKIFMYYYILKYTFHRENKIYCTHSFDLCDELSDREKEDIKSIFDIIIDIYNVDYFDCTEIKYKRYLTKDNLNTLNIKIYDYLKYKKIFESIEGDFIKEQCLICYSDDYSITLGCHFTHKICVECFEKINSCPFCRDII